MRPDFACNEAFFDAGMRRLGYAQLARIPMKPKHHLFIDLLLRARMAGNPKWHATFLDESANRHLAAVFSSAYASVWEARVFSSYKMLSTLSPASMKTQHDVRTACNIKAPRSGTSV